MPPRCPKGTRRNKKTGNCETKGSPKSPKNKTAKNQGLTKEDIEDITSFSGHIERGKLTKIKTQLKKLQEQKNYRSCFTGKKITGLFEQGLEKTRCFNKYGDPIE